jgi:hypothetical protein
MRGKKEKGEASIYSSAFNESLSCLLLLLLICQKESHCQSLKTMKNMHQILCVKESCPIEQDHPQGAL